MCSKSAALASRRVANRVRCTSSVLSEPKKLSIGGIVEAIALTAHRGIDAAVQAPMFLYQAPVGAGRMAYGAELLKELVRLPNVVGVKEGSWETAAYEANRRLIKATAPDVGVMASGDEHLLTCFILGSEGSLVSLACLWPEPIIRLERVVRDGDLEAAQAAHEVIYPLALAIYGTAPGYHATARLKACLKLLGRFSDDQVRSPITRLPASDIERLRKTLGSSGLL